MFDENTFSFAVPASEPAFLAAQKPFPPGRVYLRANSTVDSCLSACNCQSATINSFTSMAALCSRTLSRTLTRSPGADKTGVLI